MKTETEAAGAAGRSLRIAMLTVLMGAVVATGCDGERPTGPDDPERLDPALVAQGREIFRYDTFGDEAYWSDTLRMHEVVASAVSPSLALQVGLKVDVEALPAAVQQAIAVSSASRRLRRRPAASTQLPRHGARFCSTALRAAPCATIRSSRSRT